MALGAAGDGGSAAEKRATKNGFEELGLGLDACQGLESIGLSEPTEAQRRFIPALLKKAQSGLYGKDTVMREGLVQLDEKSRNFVLASETGSGKTLAFLLPIMELVRQEEALFGMQTKLGRPRALILAPTRELALQIGKIAKSLSHHIRLRTACIVGGTPPSAATKRIASGPIDLLVSTPGRALALRDAEERVFFGSVRHLVVDEADAMVGAHDGFRDEMEALLRPMEMGGELINQVWVGATMLTSKERAEAQKRKGAYGRDSSASSAMQWIRERAAKKKQEVSVVKTDTVGKLPSNLKYRIAVGSEESKHPALLSVVRGIAAEHFSKAERPPVARTLVFCNSVPSCRSTVHLLEEEALLDDFAVYSLNGSMPPVLRERQWAAFMRDADADASFKGFGTASASHKILVCTDIAARGLDFDRAIENVVMFDLPDSVSDFIHRIGRTARGADRAAPGYVTLVTKGTKRDRRLVDLLLSSIPGKDGAISTTGDGESVARLEMPLPFKLHRPNFRAMRGPDIPLRHRKIKHAPRTAKLAKKRVLRSGQPSSRSRDDEASSRDSRPSHKLYSSTRSPSLLE